MTSYDVGDYATPLLDVGTYDGTTVATCSVLAPDGTATANAATASGGGALWTGTAYALTLPGVYTERWTVTGTGRGTANRQITVTAVPPVSTAASAVPVAGVHATPADYAALMGGSASPLLLRRASLRIDRALLSAVYNTADATLGPTYLKALREATCEQAAYMIAQGWDDGIAGGYQSATIGSVTLARGQAPGGGMTPADLSSEAFAILQLAGMTGYAPGNGYPAAVSDERTFAAYGY